MAAFHSSARTSAEIASYGSPSALEARWRGNLDRLARLGAEPRLLEQVSALAFEFVAGRRPLLEARMAAGLVRYGHGDLLADVFCLADGPRALDALDFDDRLRRLDVLDDVACLAMDLERLGAPELGRGFLDAYAEFSGAPQPAALVHHYTAYRAVMRAMVAAIHGSQYQVVPPPGTVDPVHRLLQMGADHLTRGRVRLVVVGGGPASDKTTLAHALADRWGLAVVSSDRVRKELLGLDPQVHRPAAYGAGIYRPEVTKRSYRALADRAERLVGMGESVVVDGTFAGEAQRALLRAVTDRTHTATTWVRCRPPDAVVAARLRRRADRPDRLTDADAVVAAQVERHTAAWPGWPQVVEVDTSRPVGQGVDEVARTAGLGD